MKALLVMLGLLIAVPAAAKDGGLDLSAYTFPVSSLPPATHRVWKHLGENESKSFYYTYGDDPNNAGTGVFTPAHQYTAVGIAIATKGISKNYTLIEVLTGELQCQSPTGYPSYLEHAGAARYDPVSGEPVAYDPNPGIGESLPIERGSILAKAVIAICDAVAAR